MNKFTFIFVPILYLYTYNTLANILPTVPIQRLRIPVTYIMIENDSKKEVSIKLTLSEYQDFDEYVTFPKNGFTKILPNNFLIYKIPKRIINNYIYLNIEGFYQTLKNVYYLPLSLKVYYWSENQKYSKWSLINWQTKKSSTYIIDPYQLKTYLQ